MHRCYILIKLSTISRDRRPILNLLWNNIKVLYLSNISPRGEWSLHNCIFSARCNCIRSNSWYLTALAIPLGVLITASRDDPVSQPLSPEVSRDLFQHSFIYYIKCNERWRSLGHYYLIEVGNLFSLKINWT